MFDNTTNTHTLMLKVPLTQIAVMKTTWGLVVGNHMICKDHCSQKQLRMKVCGDQQTKAAACLLT